MLQTLLDQIGGGQAHSVIVHFAASCPDVLERERLEIKERGG